MAKKKELWVRWKCPIIVGKKGRTSHFQILESGDGAHPTGTLGTLIEHLRYTKRFDYRIEGNFLIVEHPFEPGPNFNLRKKWGAERAKSFCCRIEYYWEEKAE